MRCNSRVGEELCIAHLTVTGEVGGGYTFTQAGQASVCPMSQIFREVGVNYRLALLSH